MTRLACVYIVDLESSNLLIFISFSFCSFFLFFSSYPSADLPIYKDCINAVLESDYSALPGSNLVPTPFASNSPPTSTLHPQNTTSAPGVIKGAEIEQYGFTINPPSPQRINRPSQKPKPLLHRLPDQRHQPSRLALHPRRSTESNALRKRSLSRPHHIPSSLPTPSALLPLPNSLRAI